MKKLHQLSSGSESHETNALSQRDFLLRAGVLSGAATLGLRQAVQAQEKPIPGFEKAIDDPDVSKGWVPISDRKIRVGQVGYGYCKFSAAFGFQNHPNVEVVAVSDLFPDRCADLAKAVRCAKTYPSLEELVKDDKIEAVFCATDAPSHARLCTEVLNHGKHVAVSVPAVFGSLEDAENLFQTVKKSGRKYMMFETSYFHEDLYAIREIYRAGGVGKIIYSEGEYFHYQPVPLPSYKEWRVGTPPLWYPTHATADYVGASGGTFTEVSCLGMPSHIPHVRPQNNRYKNPFGTETGLFRTSEGGMSRMMVSKDTPGMGGEMVASADREVRSMESMKGSKKICPTPAVPRCLRGLRRAATGFARFSDKRICLGDPSRAHSAGEHRGGVEHDGSGYCGASVRVEGRRVDENSAVSNIIRSVRYRRDVQIWSCFVNFGSRQSRSRFWPAARSFEDAVATATTISLRSQSGCRAATSSREHHGARPPRFAIITAAWTTGG